MPLTCTCGCNQHSTTRGCRMRGMWFASRLCRYRWARKHGRLYDIPARERREIEALGETEAVHERFMPGLFAAAVLDEDGADKILKARIEEVFAAEREHIRRWRPADDSPEAELRIREMVNQGSDE